MSCPKTEYLIPAYLADDLAAAAGREIEQHLAICPDCAAELAGLRRTREQLTQWREQPVPHWDRGRELFQREHGSKAAGRPGLWQWLPAAASLAMLALMLFNTTLVWNESEFSVSFGITGGSTLETRLAQFSDQQAQRLDSVVARIENRQDAMSIELLQSVLDQTQQSTAENLERLYAYFEQQRQQDLQDLRAGYQQLLDSDYETIRSLQQLTQYISYEGELR